MKRIWLIAALLTLLLASCAAPAATEIPATQPPAATLPPLPSPTTAPQTDPIEPAQAAETQPPATEPVAADTLTFKIVPGESTVTYEVGETFINQNNRFNLAVGVTTDVNGEIFANLSDPPASTMGPVQVDISKFRSDSSRRDGVIRNQWLESSRYPIANFQPTRFEGLPAGYQDGSPYAFRVTGDLTVRDVTREVSFDVTAQLDGETLTGTATTTILMSDFSVGPISIIGILNTEDAVKLIFDFVARP